MAHRLYVSGTDKVNSVPIESIKVTEAGPGAVSSMSFTIFDPTAALTLAKYAEIVFDAGSGGTRLFSGLATTVTYSPAFADGRTIEVTATGYEVILDWLLITNSGASTGLLLTALIADGVNAVTIELTSPSPFVNETTDAAAEAGATRNGNATWPVGTLLNTTPTPDEVARTQVTMTGLGDEPQTLRQFIEMLRSHSAFSDYPAGGSIDIQRNAVPLFVTVDFDLRLRVWEDGAGLQPDDWTTLTVVDTAAGAIATTMAELTFDWGDVLDRVYVDSATGAGAGYVGSGSWPGHWSHVKDDNSTTSTTRDVIGDNIIAEARETIAGVLRIEGFTPATTVHAGGLIDFTDAAIGASGTYRISEIRKSNFIGNGKQDWEVTFGRRPRRLSRRVAMRYRTR